MPTTFNRRFQHEEKCCNILPLLLMMHIKKNRFFMCMNLDHKGQTLLLQNPPVPKDTNSDKGTKIQEYHAIQAESWLVLDSIM